jgi:DNA-binding GntR family transcriptional regulator
MALRSSLSRATPDWEEALVLAHHHMKRATANGRAAFEEQHKAFHMTLLANCESPILLKYCSQLYDLNIRYRNIAGSSQSYQTRNIPAEHEAILEAAIQRDISLTSECLLSHYRLTGAYLNGIFAEMFQARGTAL